MSSSFFGALRRRRTLAAPHPVAAAALAAAVVGTIAVPHWRDAAKAGPDAAGTVESRAATTAAVAPVSEPRAPAGSRTAAAGGRANASKADPASVSRAQADVADWIARRYRVAAAPVHKLVREAWTIGRREALEPTLILAIVGIESSFDPRAQSPVGAQGLMQVMTRVHADKFDAFGGAHAAFDPLVNLRVGAKVLIECIERAGSVEAGLRHYVGAARLPSDGGYAAKVLAEQAQLQRVAAGRPLPARRGLDS